MEDTNSKKKDLLLPASILIAAILISVSVIYSTGKNSGKGDELTGSLTPPPVGSPDKMMPISSEDHYIGNLDAPVKIVEYSDLECPFCKAFHATMQKAIAEYGDKIVWIYRHFPLENLHAKARKESEASECAAELGGNEAFWKYVNKIFEITPSNDGLDPSLLSKTAGDIGLDVTAFNKCLDSGKYSSKIDKSIEDAIASGGEGTPYSIVITEKDRSIIPGALPYERIKPILDQALQ